jgi:starvation-inducible DNA-binding protein
MSWTMPIYSSPQEPAFSRRPARTEHLVSDAKTTEKLVALLEQALADTLDLAFQVEQAHWTVDGRNACGLRLLFANLHGQLATYMDAFTQGAVTRGSQALETLHAADLWALPGGDPLDARGDKIVLGELVDHCGEYSGRIRAASRLAETLGDQDMAAFCKGISHDMDKTLWMLTSIQVA